MAEDYGITDNKKAIEDILQKYEKEKLEKRRDEILIEEKQETDLEKKKQLGPIITSFPIIVLEGMSQFAPILERESIYMLRPLPNLALRPILTPLPTYSNKFLTQKTLILFDSLPKNGESKFGSHCAKP